VTPELSPHNEESVRQKQEGSIASSVANKGGKWPEEPGMHRGTARNIAQV
jgi:hypothetical protein